MIRKYSKAIAHFVLSSLFCFQTQTVFASGQDVTFCRSILKGVIYQRITSKNIEDYRSDFALARKAFQDEKLSEDVRKEADERLKEVELALNQSRDVNANQLLLSADRSHGQDEILEFLGGYFNSAEEKDAGVHRKRLKGFYVLFGGLVLALSGFVWMPFLTSYIKSHVEAREAEHYIVPIMGMSTLAIIAISGFFANRMIKKNTPWALGNEQRYEFGNQVANYMESPDKKPLYFQDVITGLTEEVIRERIQPSLKGPTKEDVDLWLKDKAEKGKNDFSISIDSVLFLNESNRWTLSSVTRLHSHP